MNGSQLLVALVEPEQANPGAGDELIRRIQPHYPTLPIMLVSVEDNGFSAHATFQTAELLAMLQLERLRFDDLDLDAPIDEGGELPF